MLESRYQEYLLPSTLTRGTNMLNTEQDYINWPAEEGRFEAYAVLELLEEENDKDYIHQHIIMTRNHWIKVFNNAQDMKMFSDTFNSICFAKLGVAI